jgi:hypothetical protein
VLKVFLGLSNAISNKPLKVLLALKKSFKKNRLVRKKLKMLLKVQKA